MKSICAFVKIRISCGNLYVHYLQSLDLFPIAFWLQWPNFKISSLFSNFSKDKEATMFRVLWLIFFEFPLKNVPFLYIHIPFTICTFLNFPTNFIPVSLKINAPWLSFFPIFLFFWIMKTPSPCLSLSFKYPWYLMDTEWANKSFPFLRLLLQPPSYLSIYPSSGPNLE